MKKGSSENKGYRMTKTKMFSVKGRGKGRREQGVIAERSERLVNVAMEKRVEEEDRGSLVA